MAKIILNPFRLKLVAHPAHGGARLLWLVLGLLALFALARFIYGLPPWQLPDAQLPQVYLLAAAYLVFALFLFAATRGQAFSLPDGVLAGVLIFALCLGVLFLPAEPGFSRSLVVLATFAGIALGTLPYLSRLAVGRGGMWCALLLCLCAGAWLLQPGPAAGERPVEGRFTALYELNLVTHEGLFGHPDSDGGAISALGEDFLVATGNGVFYRLRGVDGEGAPTAVQLDLPSPLADRELFYRDRPNRNFRYRVTDVLVQEEAHAYQVFSAHQAWHHQDNCFSMAVSRLALNKSSLEVRQPEAGWQTIFESSPCQKMPLDPSETGGRLLMTTAGELLLTLGDMGRDGRHGPPLAQQKNNDYGKILRLDGNGGAEVLSRGHRNPQGLVQTGRGQLWATEHGPSGGDELNFIRPGANYGWPFVTYGNDYGKNFWPLAPEAQDHGAYTEPVHAFVPSIAVSNLIEVTGEEFPRWRGDLLVGTLQQQNLYRVRLRGKKVTYVEPIAVGKRIRDLHQTPTGKILLWTDDAAVVVLTRRRGAPTGAAVFTQCRRCHEAGGGGSAMAPNLAGIIGRPVAALPGYEYSAALKAVKGAWTEERLQAFIADPQVFAPGTTMAVAGVAGAADRAALLEYLRTYSP